MTPQLWTMRSEEYLLVASYPIISVTCRATARLEAYSSARADFAAAAREFVEDFFPGRDVPDVYDAAEIG